MKKAICATMLLISSGGGATAQSRVVTIETENVLRSRAHIEAHFSVKNDSGTALGMVVAHCTFFDKDDTPLATETGIIQNLQAGEKAFGKATARYSPGMTTAQCRINSAR
ncbi:hypothetical protein ACFOYU_11275 [Microvirga sp. GCM10011540]|uniref:hypothetical protein n=1 Tax=Microvirga sp. GCM10011540 TaxID=3317338 RepID=UPI003623A386